VSQLFQGNLTPKSRGDASPKTIRMFTINMLLRPPFINYNGDDFKNERLDLFIHHVLVHYDIVAVQEVFWFCNFRLSRLLAQAKARGFLWYTSNAPPPLLSRKFVDGGLLILSRYPITATTKRVFANGVQIDGWAAKQVLHAQVHLSPFTHIHVITTHTQADYAFNASNTKNAATRMSQIREIGEIIHDIWKADPKKGDVFLIGDLNVDGRAHYSENERLAQREKWGKWGELDENSLEYELMMETIKQSALHRRINDKAGKESKPEPQVIITDLVREAHGGINPVTIGDVKVLDDGRLAPREVQLTDPVTDKLSRACLDYMMHFRDLHFRLNPEKLEVVESCVKPYFFNLPKLMISQLSDHYGLSSTISLCPNDQPTFNLMG